MHQLFNLFFSYIRYKKMSSESSFDAQVFNEFDDFVPKAYSTDSESITSDPESPLATISSQGPPPLISIPPPSQHLSIQQHLGSRSTSSNLT